MLGWLRHRPFPSDGGDRRPLGRASRDHALLRPGGCPCAGLSRSHGWRVVAGTGGARRARAATGARVVLRIAPDDLLVLGGREQPAVDDPDAIVVSRDAASSGWELGPAEPSALLVRHIEWAAAGRPRPTPGPGSGRRRYRPSCGCGTTVRRCCCAPRRSPPSWRSGWRERVRRDAARSAAGHRAEAVLRRRHHRRRRSRPVHRVLPGDAPRHHERRRPGARATSARATPAATPRSSAPTTACPKPSASTSTAWSCTSSSRTRPAADIMHATKGQLWLAHSVTAARTEQTRALLNTACGAHTTYVEPGGDRPHLPADRPARRRSLPGARRLVPRRRAPPPATTAWCGRTRRARCGGASHVLQGTEVTGLLRDGDRVTGVETSTGPDRRRHRAERGRRPRHPGGRVGRRAAARPHPHPAGLRHQRLRPGARPDRQLERSASSTSPQTARGQMLIGAEFDRQPSYSQRHDVPVPAGVRPQGHHRPAVPGPPAGPAPVGRRVRRVARLLAHHGLSAASTASCCRRAGERGASRPSPPPASSWPS